MNQETYDGPPEKSREQINGGILVRVILIEERSLRRWFLERGQPSQWWRLAGKTCADHRVEMISDSGATEIIVANVQRHEALATAMRITSRGGIEYVTE